MSTPVRILTISVLSVAACLFIFFLLSSPDSKKTEDRFPTPDVTKELDKELESATSLLPIDKTNTDEEKAEKDFPSISEQGTTPWNKNTTFEVVNSTQSKYSDEQIYWGIVGRDPKTGNFVSVAEDGSFKEMQLTDNNALNKNGESYANYFHKLSDLNAVTIEPIDSARLFLAIDSPLYIKVNQDVNGQIGYAGPNVENESDPNFDIYFDFIEMALVEDLGIFVNTSRVDHFGFPLRLQLEGMDNYDRTVGETESREELFAAFQKETPEAFNNLSEAPHAPYRILAPAHGSFKEGEKNGTYLDSYINEIWGKYRSEDLEFTIQSGTYRGRVTGDRFEFTDVSKGGSYNINGKPTTEMVLLGNGLLDDTKEASGENAVAVQLQIQAQMTAALNRRVAHDPSLWGDHAAYHPSEERSNFYAAFWHNHSIDNLAYGFSYDDVAEYSPSLHVNNPEKVTVEVDW